MSAAEMFAAEIVVRIDIHAKQPRDLAFRHAPRDIAFSLHPTWKPFLDFF